MESQTKPGFDGTQVPASRGYGVRAPLPSPSNPLQLPGYILRVIAIVLTFIAAIVMGVAKETNTPEDTDSNAGEVYIFLGTAKSTYSSAFVYFIVVNVLVFLYSAAALAMTLLNRAGSSNLELPFTMADLVVVVLLFSSNGAAIAVSVIAEKGNSQLGWGKICSGVGKFCSHVVGSIVLSMLASVAYALLVLLAISSLHKRSY